MGLLEIKEAINAAEDRAGRAAGSVQLVAVSKVQPNERVLAVLEQGHRFFGENRVQEASKKWPAFLERFPDANVHLIGPLQTNKVRASFDLFSGIQSVDRMKLATSIARIAQEAGRCPDLFVQVNTGEEPQKAGILPSDSDAFVAECLAMDLPIKGLMCIPPVDEEPTLHFALLAKIAARNGIADLSMGMSSDFERAIMQGATHVRIGSAIFGARAYG